MSDRRPQLMRFVPFEEQVRYMMLTKWIERGRKFREVCAEAGLGPRRIRAFFLGDPEVDLRINDLARWFYVLGVDIDVKYEPRDRTANIRLISGAA